MSLKRLFKKAKDIVTFEKFHTKDLLKRLKDDPKRLILGVDPLSTKAWNKVLDRDDDPLVNVLGGAHEGVYQRAEDRGIDTGPGRTMQNIAGVVAGSIAGGYGLGKLGTLGKAASVGDKPSVLQRATSIVSKPEGGLDFGKAMQAMQTLGSLQNPQAYEDYGLEEYGHGPQLPDWYHSSLPQIEYRGRQRSSPVDLTNYGEQLGEQMFYGSRGGSVNELRTQNSTNCKNPVKVRLRERNPFQEGGLAQAAQAVRGAGRYGDDVLLHVSPEEYRELVGAWGEPTINPETGMPEFFLKKLKKFVKRALKNPIVGMIAPMVMNALLPGVGGLIGQSLFGAASSAAKGGNPLLGGVLGGAGHILSGGNVRVGDAAKTGPSLLQKGITKIPTTTGSAAIENMAHGVEPGVLAKIGDKVAPIATNIAEKAASPLGQFATAAGTEGLRSAEAAYAQAMKDAERAGQQAEQQSVDDGSFGSPLQQLSYSRSRRAPADYFTYGEAGPEFEFFDPNTIPSPLPAEDSGALTAPMGGVGSIGDFYEDPRFDYDRGYARGGVRGPGSGRSDDIPAQLSDGEYVMDAETVALLGDGSVDEGARRLDDMRKNLRQHKAKNLSKGRFSHAAKEPVEYMQRGGSIRRALQGVRGKITARKYMGDDEASWAVFDGPTPVFTGLTRSEVDYYKRMAADIVKKKKEGGQAEGGVISYNRGGDVVKPLLELADQFDREIRGGNRRRVAELAAQMDILRPGSSRLARAEFSRGGSVMNAIKRLLERADTTKSVQSFRTADQDVNAEAMLLALRQMEEDQFYRDNVLQESAMREIRKKYLPRRIRDERR